MDFFTGDAVKNIEKSVFDVFFITNTIELSKEAEESKKNK